MFACSSVFESDVYNTDTCNGFETVELRQWSRTKWEINSGAFYYEWGDLCKYVIIRYCSVLVVLFSGRWYNQKRITCLNMYDIYDNVHQSVIRLKRLCRFPLYFQNSSDPLRLGLRLEKLCWGIWYQHVSRTPVSREVGPPEIWHVFPSHPTDARFGGQVNTLNSVMFLKSFLSNFWGVKESVILLKEASIHSREYCCHGGVYLVCSND